MTQTKYKSSDDIIEIVTTNDDARYPRHSAKMTLIKMKPTPHSRCRYEGTTVTLMPTFNEVRALLEALKSCDSSFDFWITKKSASKPEARKQKFQEWNRRRLHLQNH